MQYLRNKLEDLEFDQVYLNINTIIIPVKLFPCCVIYAEGCIAFVFPFIYISVTTYMKAFIFGLKLPWRVGINIMNQDPRVGTLGWDGGQILGQFLKYDKLPVMYIISISW